MSALGRLIRRYVLAGVGIALGIVLLNVAIFIGIVGVVGYRQAFSIARYFPSEIAAGFTLDEAGNPAPGPEHTPAEWFSGFAWAMMLDDDGNVIYRYNLPESLDHPYTTSEVVSFARWYLEDYPVMSYLTEYGVLVLGRPPGSVNRYNFYMDTEINEALLGAVRPVLALNLVLIVVPCALLAWAMHRRLRGVEHGLQELAEGRPVQLAETGATAALARQLNRTSAHLRRQSETIARRDAARTEWVAGVSHDIRTPLALIFGYAERLESDDTLGPAQRGMAGAIKAQGQVIRGLIEDLNLTSKLQYGAQPLRRAPTAAGALLRGAVIDFINSDPGCEVGFTATPAAEAAVIDVDAPLIRRAMANLLGNSARHNPGGCTVAVSADAAEGWLTVTVDDDGAGYPLAVLTALDPEAAENAAPDAPRPHILGLHIVAQIAAAHGGSARFANTEHGAQAVMRLPTAGKIGS